jgi:hypothetical protein
MVSKGLTIPILIGSIYKYMHLTQKFKTTNYNDIHEIINKHDVDELLMREVFIKNGDYFVNTYSVPTDLLKNNKFLERKLGKTKMIEINNYGYDKFIKRCLFPSRYMFAVDKNDKLFHKKLLEKEEKCVENKEIYKLTDIIDDEDFPYTTLKIRLRILSEYFEEGIYLLSDETPMRKLPETFRIRYRYNPGVFINDVLLSVFITVSGIYSFYNEKFLLSFFNF